MSAAWIETWRGTPVEEAARLLARLDKEAGRPMSAEEIVELELHYQATAHALRTLIVQRADAATGESIAALKAVAADEVTLWLERHPGQTAVRAPVTAQDISVDEVPMEVEVPIRTSGWWASVKHPDLQEIGDGAAAHDPRAALGLFILRVRGDS